MRSVGYGIDFGTTNSVLATYDPGTEKSAGLLDEGNGLPHPSVIWLRPDAPPIVGRQAKDNRAEYERATGHQFVSSIKRSFGETDTVPVFGERRPIESVAASIFKFLRGDAHERGKGPVSSAVLTVPVRFDGRARRTLRQAAESAGIQVRAFVHEPFAAVVGYLFKQRKARSQGGSLEGQRVLVFDWGGGTLDLTLTEVKNGVIYELATGGLPDTAGDDFDEAIARFCNLRLAETAGVPLDSIDPTPADRGRLLLECENKKIELSSKASVRLMAVDYCRIGSRFVDLDVELTRGTFESLIANDVDLALSQVTQVLLEAQLQESDIDAVLLIGGTSRIPIVRSLLSERFGAKICDVPGADTIIAEGAAIVDGLGLMPVLASDLSVELADGALHRVFSRGTPLLGGHLTHTENFYCVDPRDGHARVILHEKVLGGSRMRPRRHVVAVPVSRTVPRPRQAERLTCTFNLDHDFVLHLSGRATTQREGGAAEIVDLRFGLRLGED